MKDNETCNFCEGRKVLRKNPDPLGKIKREMVEYYCPECSKLDEVHSAVKSSCPACDGEGFIYERNRWKLAHPGVASYGGRGKRSRKKRCFMCNGHGKIKIIPRWERIDSKEEKQKDTEQRSKNLKKPKLLPKRTKGEEIPLAKPKPLHRSEGKPLASQKTKNLKILWVLILFAGIFIGGLTYKGEILPLVEKYMPEGNGGGNANPNTPDRGEGGNSISSTDNGTVSNGSGGLGIVESHSVLPPGQNDNYTLGQGEYLSRNFPRPVPDTYTGAVVGVYGEEKEGITWIKKKIYAFNFSSEEEASQFRDSMAEYYKNSDSDVDPKQENVEGLKVFFRFSNPDIQYMGCFFSKGKYVYYLRMFISKDDAVEYIEEKFGESSLSKRENLNNQRTSEGEEKKTEQVMPKYKKGPKERTFKYTIRGDSANISYTVYAGLNNYLAGISRYYYCDPECPSDREIALRYLNQEEQRKNLEILVKKIRSKTGEPDEQARIAVSLVQKIPYDWNAYYDMDTYKTGDRVARYPYEVLYDKKGVCEEKSKLLAYILRELGFGVVLFGYEAENHMAVGIKCPAQYSYRNTGYCFVETTSPSIITDAQGNYVGVGKLSSKPEVIRISDGRSLDSVSEEYNDAREWDRLREKISESPGGLLSRYDYHRWKRLVNKYGIETEETDETEEGLSITIPAE